MADHNIFDDLKTTVNKSFIRATNLDTRCVVQEGVEPSKNGSGVSHDCQMFTIVVDHQSQALDHGIQFCNIDVSLVGRWMQPTTIFKHMAILSENVTQNNIGCITSNLARC